MACGKRRRLAVILTAIVLCAVSIVGVSCGVVMSTKPDIAGSLQSPQAQFTAEEIADFRSLHADCIMVLGASVTSDGQPSPMLRDRLDTGIALYRVGAAPKLLMTGDNGQVEYNEVDVMLQYALRQGVPEEDIFLDHAGFSTYESVYRARYIFGVGSMIAVTQTYHLYRTLYSCRRMGIAALGAGADQKQYRGQQMREVREVLARDKDAVKWLFRPDPTYLGEAIPITGDGSSTH